MLIIQFAYFFHLALIRINYNRLSYHYFYLIKYSASIILSQVYINLRIFILTQMLFNLINSILFQFNS